MTKPKIECSLSDCKNKADYGMGWGNSKGTIPICKLCLESYEQHMKTRKELGL